MEKIAKGHYTYRGHTIKLIESENGSRPYWTASIITDGTYAEGSDTRKDMVDAIDRFKSEWITGPCTFFGEQK